MAKVFFSYSHKDAALRDQLEDHLALMKHQGLIESWHDQKIDVGSDLDPEILKNLEACEVILLLITSSFMASTYCFSKEMSRAVERHNAGEALVIPVILKKCDWQTAPFGGIKCAPHDAKPVTLWPDIDEAFTDVAKSIRSALEARQKASGALARQQLQPAASARLTMALPGLPRSSNLSLKKEFTQQDRDNFLRQGFEFLGRFFEGSLQELQERNPGISAEFERIDARRFTAVIYRQGNCVAQCQVFLQGMGSGMRRTGEIGFSHAISDQTNSYNESVHVEGDDQCLFFAAMGMQSFGQTAKHKHLAPEGVAELFWSMLIASLQGSSRQQFS